MLQEYLANKSYIVRQIMAAEFDELMVQDAMAIILLPSPQGAGCRRLRKRESRPIWKHMLAWSKSQLPDPIKDRNDDLLSQLNKLHNLIVLLVEDYITKATASFPPREYLCLPQIQSPSAEGHLMFKGVKVTPRFNSANLTSLERKRFLKAFLVYELLCKISNAPHASRLIRHYREVSDTDYEAVGCVHNYVRSLYGAMFAQCNDAWLPSPSTGASLETGLLFPDTFYFDANMYSTHLGLNKKVYYLDIETSFSMTGFEYLNNFLGYDLANPDKREALKLQIKYVWDFEEPYRSYTWDENFMLLLTIKPTNKDGYESSMYKQLSLEPGNNLRHKIFEQRAWVFFDDSRFYPEESIERPNFPSESFLFEEPSKQCSIAAWFHDPKKERTLRRSQQWHDERDAAGESNVNTSRGRDIS
ncbi:hypothetical protein ACHAP7_008001 [Fusarium lateritium]